MQDSINANISHAYYYNAAAISDLGALSDKLRDACPQLLPYSLRGAAPLPAMRDMQVVEDFLHGGGQTYQVHRWFLPELTPDFAAAGLRDWCAMLAYFPETSIIAISFHYTLENTTTDNLIALRQSGDGRTYRFPGGEGSCKSKAAELAAALGLPYEPLEGSYLAEITRFGDYTDIEAIHREQLQRLYGFISGDEGYDFVPAELAEERLSSYWSSRDFIRIYASGKAFIFLNLIDSPAHQAYLQRQHQFGTATYGGVNPYFLLRSCPLTVNHGILFSVEFVMMLKALINDVLAFQSEYSNNRNQSYYKRIRETREFRRKIIMVLEKVESTAIAEIGQLSNMLLDSQNISPIIDQVKYLLELLEADLSLIYSERNNMLVTALTLIGLLFAAWQIILAL
ncbi:MAG: hypothetical protein IJO80_01040 [Firmicutes bacterium]|nr:hypothetical protein [Bacillota bacterium]